MRKTFKNKINIGKLGKKKVKLVLGLFFSILFLFSLNFSTNFMTYVDNKSIRKSGICATLDLIDIYNVNNSRHPHNSLIQIYGRLYNRIWDDGKQGYTVALKIDGILYPGINERRRYAENTRSMRASPRWDNAISWSAFEKARRTI